jgi:hypothetical protein
MYYTPWYVDSFLTGPNAKVQPLEFGQLNSIGRELLAVLLLIYGRGGTVPEYDSLGTLSWAQEVLSWQDPVPLLWHKLPMGVKQWAAAGLPGLHDLQEPALDVLVGIICKSARLHDPADWQLDVCKQRFG